MVSVAPPAGRRHYVRPRVSEAGRPSPTLVQRRHRGKESSMAEANGFAGLKLRQRPPGSARVLHPELSPFLVEYRARGEAATAEPFKGITTDGTVLGDLFHIARTGISTRPIQDAAEAFLDGLTPEQRAQALFSVESDAWRRWSNIHPWI